MKEYQKNKIQRLVNKYNDVLLESMRNSVCDDLIRLIILNEEDQNRELKDLIESQTEFKKIIFKEFIRANSSLVNQEFKRMKEFRFALNK